MDACENGFAVAEITHDQSHVLTIIDQRAIPDRCERSMACRDASFDHTLHQLLRPTSIRDQVGNGPHGQFVLLGKTLEFGKPRHSAVVIHDLREHTGRVLTSKTGEVHSGLGVPGPFQHTTGLVSQGVHVAGSGQVPRLGIRVEDRLDRPATVGGGDTGGGALGSVNRNGERRSTHICVIGNHHRKIELIETLANDGETDDAAGVSEHHANLVRRGIFGSNDEIAFVLTIFVIDHYHHLPAGDRLDYLLDPCERHSLASNSLSTYLAITSFSRFTVSPGFRKPRVVKSSVCGIRATENDPAVIAATVRLTPSTVIEPFSTVNDMRAAGASMVINVPPSSWLMALTTPTPST